MMNTGKLGAILATLLMIAAVAYGQAMSSASAPDASKYTTD